MESANITQLLEAYFEGETTLAQEKSLRTYFAGDQIAPEHESYVPLFNGLQVAKEETMVQSITFPKQNKKPRYSWWMGIAASAVIVLSVSAYVYNDSNELTAEEQFAYNQTKEALFLLSKNLNKGAVELDHLNEFTNTTNKYFK